MMSLLISFVFLMQMISIYRTFIFSLLTAGLLFSVACNKESYTPPSPFNNPDNDSTDTTINIKRLLALGDSYTIGQGVTEPDRFPNQTINLLRAQGIQVKYPATIVAQTGWTTQALLNGIVNASSTISGTYDLVTLLIGVNNQYQGRDTVEYRIQFNQCLDKAISFAGNQKQRVFVLSIPDYGVTPFGSGNAAQIALEIDRFNAINKDVCIQRGINYTDITPSTREAANDPGLICSDSLHPSGIEYAKWARMLAPKMLPVIQ